jgi:hypothetical protein
MVLLTLTLPANGMQGKKYLKDGRPRRIPFNKRETRGVRSMKKGPFILADRSPPSAMISTTKGSMVQLTLPLPENEMRGKEI